jgi:hypothetical protein
VRATIATLAALSAACSAAPAPALHSVEPATVYEDEAVELVVRGVFQAPVIANLDWPASSTLKAYTLELSSGGRLVTTIPASFRDERTLSAMFPAGNPVGTYGVLAVDPWGKAALLEDGFRVIARETSLLDPPDGGSDAGACDAGEGVDGGVCRLPPLARIDVAPGLGDVTTLFAFDAAGSTDERTPTSALEVSWSFEETDVERTWTPWTTAKGTTSTFPAGKETLLLQVRDEDGDVAYAAKRIFVAADTLPICIVTTAADDDDGAQDCTTSLGPDGKLSFREAVRIANMKLQQLIAFDLPVPSALSGNSGPPIQIDEAVRIAGSPGVTLERELVIASANQVRITGLVVQGPGGKLRITADGKLDITDSEIRHAESIRVAGTLHLRRTLLRDCLSACIAGEGAGSLLVEQSSFFANPVGGTAIDLVTCPPDPLAGPVMELVGNTFAGFSTAVSVGANCDRSTSIVHQTFHRNTVAVAYQGGQRHVLQNNVFSEQTGTTVLGCGQPSLFATRRNHALYANASDACLLDDPGVVSVDPRFAAPGAGDLRLRYGSPLIDTAPLVGGGAVDVNGAAPGLYFGAGPDYGGRETY